VLPPLLADLNVAPAVVEFLRTAGVDVLTAGELELVSRVRSS
jgi:hypothetical protein